MAEPSVLLVHEFGGAFGGAERYLELLGQGIVDAGSDVAAVVFVDDGERAEALRTRLEAIAPSVTVVVGRSRPGPVCAAIRAHRPAVLHWNFVDPFAFRGASWLLLPWGRPSVITDHLPQLRHAGPHWETTRRLANRRIAMMVVVGNAARAEARRRWRRPPPLAVIPNGVPLAPNAAARRTRADGSVHLLFVGRLTEQKGAGQLVPDLAAMRTAGVDARLTIVGDGPLDEEIRSSARAAHMEEHVTFTGFSPAPMQEMAAADALVAPSAYEGLPFTPLEALSTGLPLILSDIAPHRELAGDDPDPGIQLVPQDDQAGWVAAVRGLALDLPASSAAALARARQHDAAGMVARTLDVYRQVCGRRGPSVATDPVGRHLDRPGATADGAR